VAIHRSSEASLPYRGHMLDAVVDGEGLRELLESLAVIGGVGLIVLWRRTSRIALDLARRHL